MGRGGRGKEQSRAAPPAPTRCPLPHCIPSRPVPTRGTHISRGGEAAAEAAPAEAADGGGGGCDFLIPLRGENPAAT